MIILRATILRGMTKKNSHGTRTNIMSTDQDFASVPQELLTRTCIRSSRMSSEDFSMISRRPSYKDLYRILSRGSLKDLPRTGSRHRRTSRDDIMRISARSSQQDLYKIMQRHLCQKFSSGPLRIFLQGLVQDHARSFRKDFSWVFTRIFVQDLYKIFAQGSLDKDLYNFSNKDLNKLFFSMNC